MNKKKINPYPELSKKIYSKIDLLLREKKVNRYEAAEKIGISKQAFSDMLLRMKDGQMPKLTTLLSLQDFLEEEIIFFKF